MEDAGDEVLLEHWVTIRWRCEGQQKRLVTGIEIGQLDASEDGCLGVRFQSSSDVVDETHTSTLAQHPGQFVQKVTMSTPLSALATLQTHVNL